MVLSMTGFATRTVHLTLNQETVTVTLTLKSLNSRFFEAQCKMPHALSHLENGFIKKLRAALHRGTIYSTLHVSSLAPLTGAINPSLKTIESYLKAIQTIQHTFNLTGETNIQELLKLPHVFDIAEQELDQASTNAIVEQMDQLILDLIKERLSEGAVLQKDLEERMHDMHTALKQVEIRAQLALEERKKKLSDNAQEFLNDASQEVRDQQLQIIFNQLDKMDIHEEIVRFTMHLKSLEATLHEKSEEKGKKFDFILQEMFREINTMSAKCSDPELSSLAITIKVALEKSREQTQNIV